MCGRRYTEEFQSEAVKQVTEHGHPLGEVAARLGMSAWSLSRWMKRRQVPAAERAQAAEQPVELRRLKAELKRVTEERGILKKAAARRATAVPCHGCASRRLLRAVRRTAVSPGH